MIQLYVIERVVANLSAEKLEALESRQRQMRDYFANVDRVDCEGN